MSNKAKLFIEGDAEKQLILAKLIADHPEEFEIVQISLDISNPVTEAGRVVSEFTAAQTNVLYKRISEIFMTVGIPAHIKGYQFLREAIRLTIERPGIINCITKQLYPAVARGFNTTSSKVERAIRHAIEVGWARGRIENINQLFGVKIYGQHDRPTNGEFIALVADKLMLDGVK